MVFLSTFQYHYWHRQTNIVGECQTPLSKDYLRPLQSQASGWIFRRSSRIYRVFQWLFSLSLINNLFGCTTKNILVIYREHPEAAKNILATRIIQRLKALAYKELMNFFLTVFPQPFVAKFAFIPPLKRGGLSRSRTL